MIKTQKAVIVEGKYDKIRLSQVIEGLIITTEGFRIFKDEKKRQLIRNLAETCGIIIITDSDKAGFVIRNHIKGIVDKGDITNIYIPRIKGKEKRKEKPGCEGILGVEGIDNATLEFLIKRELTGIAEPKPPFLDKARFFDDGLTGKKDSAILRRKLLSILSLPEYLSCDSMIKTINRVFSEDEYTEALKKISEQLKG